MAVLTTRPKLLNFFEQNIISQLEKWFSLLLQGDIHKFESQLSECLSAVYDEIGEQLLSKAAQSLEPY